MTSNDREPRLPKRAEELLAGWPAPSRGALAWEDNASGVMSRVRQTEIGSTPDDLLAEPLPEEPDEERHEPEQSAPSDAPPVGELSLAGIARAALSGSEAANREVARDGFLAAEEGRKNPREVPPVSRAMLSAAGLQGRVVRVSEPMQRPPTPVAVAPKAELLAAVPAEPAHAPVTEAAARSEFPAPASREPRRFGAPALGGAVLALAAAAALYLSFARNDGSEARLTASAEAPLPPSVREQAATPSVQTADTAAEAKAVASVAPAASTALAFDDLTLAPKSRASSGNTSKEKSLAFHVKKENAASAGKLVLEERDEASSENAAPPPAQAAPPPPQPLAERPSTGAVSAALGPVLMSARSCVAGQDSGPRATVTFDGPTGRVKSVTLDSTATGSPAESCVRAALMGARLPPFADPTFTASVTVRPL